MSTRKNRTKKTIHTPENGWLPQALYLVDVSYRDSNPIHRAYFFTGFLDDNGNPSSYNYITSGGYSDDPYPISSVRYLKPIRLLTTKDDLLPGRYPHRAVGPLPADRETEEAEEAEEKRIMKKLLKNI
jgi:hypothetical protein